MFTDRIARTIMGMTMPTTKDMCMVRTARMTTITPWRRHATPCAKLDATILAPAGVARNSRSAMAIRVAPERCSGAQDTRRARETRL